MKSLKSEVSKKSKWYISKYRYLELKNMCLQYPEWIKEYENRKLLNSSSIIFTDGEPEWSDPSFETIKRTELLEKKIIFVRKAAFETDPILAVYILKAVTYGLSYDILSPPCGRRQFYERYRKYFWILDKFLNP